MSAGVCAVYPLIDGQESELYKGLFKYTSRNRKLTNYLYALSLQPEIMSKVSSSDLNGQGEIKLSKVVELLNVDSLLDTTATIKNAEAELHATNSSGELVDYEDVSEIIDRVVEFNEREGNSVVAKIVKTDSGYNISILPKDSENFAINSTYKAGIKQMAYISDVLGRQGINVGLISKSAKQQLNATNARNFPQIISLWQGIASGRVRNLSENNIQLLIELLTQIDNGSIERLKAKFGDKLVPAVKFLLSEKRDIPDELQEFEEAFGLASTSGALNSFKILIDSTFRGYRINELENDLNSLYYNDTLPEEDKNLKETLKDLYEKWNLDKDTVVTLYNEIQSTKDVVTKIILGIDNNRKILRARGQLNPEKAEEYENTIKVLEEKLSKKQYAASIIDFLEDTVDYLQNILSLDTSLIEESSLNSIAAQLLSIKEFNSTFSPIISKLLNIDSLEGSADLEAEDVNKIKDLANKTNSILSTVNDIVYKKAFNVVYATLKPYWGEETKTAGGLNSFEIALNDALTCGNINMNLFDRGLSAMTEVADPVLATLGAVIKDMHEVRDEKLRQIQLDIRRATHKLYESGSNSEFMFEQLKDGSYKIVSEVDWDAYYEAFEAKKQEYKDKGIKGAKLNELMQRWVEENNEVMTLDIKYNSSISLDEFTDNITTVVPNSKYRKSLPSMTEAQKEYYNTMLVLKASLERNLELHGIETSLFTPVQITSEISDAIANSSPSEALKLVKDNFVDKFKIREDDTAFGDKEVILSASGERIKSLPVFYLHSLKDQRRLNKDFSKSMLAFASMEVNHETLAERINTLELAKDFLLERPITQSEADRALVQASVISGTRYVSPAVRKTKETLAGGWLQDIFDAKVYGQRQRVEGNFLGINTAKATNALTGYTSVTGLTMNVPGAIANALVGKVQMIIEAGGGEFFGFKDADKASRDYWKMLPPLLGEVMSNNKTSTLGLLMEKFDVLDDFYDRLKETGFYKSAAGKIIGNTSIMFLYGMGEHLLHAQTMLAILNHVKVKDERGNTKRLLDAFEVNVKDGNGELKIKDGWKTIDGYEINESFIQRQKKVIGYVNRSMHGAFGADEKGAIHRYAIGRLIMNFRQWMPAHYARRFNKLHYDATLGDFREGYYVTCFKFARQLGKDLMNKKFDILTRWSELKQNPMEFSNVKRALTETIILMTLALISRLSFGDDPHNRTWAESMLKYEVRRMLLETGGSSPLAGSQFISNIYTILNEPIAAISSAQRLTRLFAIEDLIFMKRIESGVNAGKLKYTRNIERAIPFYDQVNKWWNMDTDNSMFTVFNKN